ncbi:MAG: ABC transporter permease subunit [Rhodoferax sp.]|nr:ABC transporter permease subunit [Rhodoferax sp.]
MASQPKRLAQWLRACCFPFSALAVLEWYSRTAGKDSDALAPPTAALRALGRAALDGSLLQATAFTLSAAALGLAVAAVLGIAFGIALGLSQRAAHVSFFSIEVLRPIPSVALIPLAMLVFGFGLRMEFSIVAFACFWPLLILTQAAVQQVEPRLLEVSHVLGLSPAQRSLKIILPAIVPRLFVALRLGLSLALVVAVTVEVAANPNGMGYAMMIAQQSLQPALMLGWLVWIGLLGYAINVAALRLQRWVGHRMGVTA